MPVGDDDARASAYRQQAVRRQAFRDSLRVRMMGNEAAAMAVRDHWRAVSDPQIEDMGGVTDDGSDRPIQGVANS
jgi:hypothetical protein